MTQFLTAERLYGNFKIAETITADPHFDFY